MKGLNIRNVFNVALLISCLAALPACDMLKNKSCKDCAPSTPLTGQALLTADGKPLITVDSFEDFWKSYLENVDPQTRMYLDFVPNMREQMFNQLEPVEIALLWAEKENKMGAEFQSKLQKQIDLFKKGLALQLLKEDLQKGLDKSDESLEKFYNENRNKMSHMFGRPPFIKTPAAVEVVSVEFAKENEAKDFAEKAKAEGADFNALAKTAKKDVKKLGLISPDSKNVDASIKIRAANLEVGDVAKVNVGKDKFAVIKAIGKKDAEYAPYSEIKSNAEARNALEQIMEDTQLSDLFAKKLEDLKQKYNIVKNTAFFEEERKAKEAKTKAESEPVATEGSNSADAAVESSEATADATEAA